MAYFTDQNITGNRFEGSWFYRVYGKRVLDIVLVFCAVPVWLPLVGLLWILAWLESGVGLYVDMRVGRFGALFRCVKIRTMQPDTSRECAAVKPLYDPRITRLGMFLRRASLDELPQLWCVFKGEMSLVGPRPVPETELRLYRGHRACYLQMRPGLTGLWQVSGRNALSYDTRIALDIAYAQNVTFGKDLRILRATFLEIWRLNGR